MVSSFSSLGHLPMKNASGCPSPVSRSVTTWEQTSELRCGEVQRRGGALGAQVMPRLRFLPLAAWCTPESFHGFQSPGCFQAYESRISEWGTQTLWLLKFPTWFHFRLPASVSYYLCKRLLQPQPQPLLWTWGVALARKMVLPAGSHVNSQRRFLEPFTSVPEVKTSDIHGVLVIYPCITN